MPKSAPKSKKPTSPPPAIVPIVCDDKLFETDPPQDHPASMPRGSRIAVVADPGRGKSSFIKNALCRSSPWKAVYVIHGAAGSTEYDLVTHTKLSWADATPEYWAEQSRTHKKEPLALVVDDCAYADLNRKEKSNAYACLQHACTHHNVTAWLASHSLTQLVPRLRRCCDIMCLWPPTTGGHDQVPYLARTLGLPRQLLQAAFDVAAARGPFSFLTIYQNPPEGRSRIMLDCEYPITLDA